ncbi:MULTISPECIES: LPXTG cell wall anchor domain-containing protein [Breznakia]|uniref:LPXTG-motif cell wall-anchored protein n=1 Tax=Breznakia blatticola TaxID=1754012 RepID=A0A4R7ZQI4_9FIRM|nr:MULTISPECIES: LPXTG cell wall anchor domain-containing protein [Breznakia]MDH6367503.1 LPXTG-motif cell wall-anchored protein [Breznakia sp. PH1-1]MDH6404623.1 LPXTG-motif cell wall-anchored protein [Breznakia sp. PF1-11]MDH6412332.1 LPXTG-motif cell wall-anchored protein [Breznakia sp. PFB1-11]MDH6414670.1 LPXTG-motif cell wall-anchored protein [Breznakia sp. PFB1-14]MDH6416935.1 LPXTG-motif cell wall-anchored protein [Breznakia sp. PFB1-4]
MQNRKGKIWLLVCVLFICVAITVSVIGNHLIYISQIEKEAISLFPSVAVESDETNDEGGSSSIAITNNANGVGTQQNTEGIETFDNKQTWSTETDVEIFKLTYTNDDGKVSVVSSNGEEVIAPGTENEYTFHIKNNGSTTVKYQMTCEVLTSPSDVDFPVNIAMKSYTGDYLLGSDQGMERLAKGSFIRDEASLYAKNYAYYTLFWEWPFEQGDDDFDTYLGNRAVDEDLTVTVVIRTYAWSDENSQIADGGLRNPNTGDTTNVMYYLMLGGIAVVLVACIIWKKKKDGEHDEE